jgi:CHASE2 domain-containing sensor protein
MGRSLHFVERPYEVVYEQAALGADYRGKIVIIGARIPSELVNLGPGGPPGSVYGYQVHARVLSDLLAGTNPHRATAREQGLILALLLLIGALARRYLPIATVKLPIGWMKDFPLPLGFFIVAVACLLALILAFRSQYVLFDMGYALLALALGYYAIPRLSGLERALAPSAPTKPRAGRRS